VDDAIKRKNFLEALRHIEHHRTARQFDFQLKKSSCEANQPAILEIKLCHLLH